MNENTHTHKNIKRKYKIRKYKNQKARVGRFPQKYKIRKLKNKTKILIEYITNFY